MLCSNMRIRYSSFSFAVALLFPWLAFAQTPSFRDVPVNHPAYSAIESLKQANIIQGYPDGTFQPGKIVSRAEAVTLILRPLASAEQVTSTKNVSAYTDVAADAWYAAYVELARGEFGMIDGPPKTTQFSPSVSVNKAQFLKLLLRAYGIDSTAQYAEITSALASDAARSDEWFYPYVRYALTASMGITESNGTITPGKSLTRGEIAQLMYQFLLYREGQRTQSLLTSAEQHLIAALQLLERKDLAQAEYAISRALLLSRGALASKPDEPLVKGAVKVSEGFVALLAAHKAGVSGKLPVVVEHAGAAWQKAEEARTFSSSLDTLAAQMQVLAKKMADEARALMNAIQEKLQ